MCKNHCAHNVMVIAPKKTNQNKTEMLQHKLILFLAGEATCTFSALCLIQYLCRMVAFMQRSKCILPSTYPMLLAEGNWAQALEEPQLLSTGALVCTMEGQGLYSWGTVNTFPRL